MVFAELHEEHCIKSVRISLAFYHNRMLKYFYSNRMVTRITHIRTNKMPSICQVPFISTAHITQDDFERLWESTHQNLQPMVWRINNPLEKDAGVFLGVDESSAFDEFEGYSLGFYQLGHWCKLNDFSLVCLQSDGDLIDGLPIHNDDW